MDREGAVEQDAAERARPILIDDLSARSINWTETRPRLWLTKWVVT